MGGEHGWEERQGGVRVKLQSCEAVAGGGMGGSGWVR